LAVLLYALLTVVILFFLDIDLTVMQTVILVGDITIIASIVNEINVAINKKIDKNKRVK